MLRGSRRRSRATRERGEAKGERPMAYRDAGPEAAAAEARCKGGIRWHDGRLEKCVGGRWRPITSPPSTKPPTVPRPEIHVDHPTGATWLIPQTPIPREKGSEVRRLLPELRTRVADAARRTAWTVQQVPARLSRRTSKL